MRCFIYGLIAMGSAAWAAEAPGFDAAAAFGALPSVSDLRLSPDGKSVSYIAPNGMGNAVYTYDLDKKGNPVLAFLASGKPERISDCSWVSNERLVCEIGGVVKNPSVGILPFSRVIAVDRNGANLQLLSTKTNEYSTEYELNGGEVLDWLPEEDGVVLMMRNYVPDEHLGSRAGSAKKGWGVDRVDTRNAKVQTVEDPAVNAVDYISDGAGNVRIIARTSTVQGDQQSGILRYFYRKTGSREWLPLSTAGTDKSGFTPMAVDPGRNLAYGTESRDGRQAIVTVSLDGSLEKTLVYANPEVDVDWLVRIGRRNRVVGVSYATEFRHAFYFDAEIDRLIRSLAKALPNQGGVRIVDSSVDEQVLLVLADSDDDPGVYYVFDRRTKELKTFLTVRDQLEGVKLAKVKPVSFRATDGTQIPGYLTLPPGMEAARGIPAIVLPHGGPDARDEWGFDWLPQYYASRGYAVLQPNFRGSSGYGDQWLKNNGFKSWRVAIGDVVDAGRWLVSEGIADPNKLSIVGWSYGGYAALQSAVVEPGLFKAVVAIAPVTDFQQHKEEWRNFDNFYLISNQIGEGPHIREGSPAQNAEKIKVPVLMFHGTMDRNVSIMQSRTMDARLAKTGVKHQLVVFEGLDHQLEDSSARSEMLRKSDQFMRDAWPTTLTSRRN